MSYQPAAHGALCELCVLKGKPVVPPEENVNPQQHSDGKAVFALVGEAPGEMEEKFGKPFVGPSGMELDNAMRASGLKRRECHVTNVLLCRPDDNKLAELLTKISKENKEKEREWREATDYAERNGWAPPEPPVYTKSPIDCCKPRLEKELANFTKFVTLGKTATQAVTGRNDSIMNIRGAVQTLEATERTPARLVMPTLHPSFILRTQKWAHVFRNDLLKAARAFRGQSQWKPPKVTYHPSPDQLRAFLSDPNRIYTYDLETDGIESLSARIRCVGIGDENEVVLIGILGKDGSRKFYLPWEEREIKSILKAFFEDENRVKAGHNAGYYDKLVLNSQWDCDPKPLVDTILLHKSVESELPHGLAYVASLYTDAPPWKSDRENSKIATHAESDEQLHEYCAKDVAITAAVLPQLVEQVKLRDQMDVWRMDQRIQVVCADMHAVGMFVDQAARLKEEKKMLQRRHELLGQVRDRLHMPSFNPGSTQQLRAILFDRWKLEPPLEEEERFTSSGDPSTADLVLRSLLTSHDVPEDKREIIKLIRYYRKVQKVLGTYVVKLRPQGIKIEDDLGWFDEDDDYIDKETRKKYGLAKEGIVDPRTGRMHPGYNAHVAVTGRLSSSKPINCFDGETEILTELGWVRFDQLLEDHRSAKDCRVAQWDEVTKEITFVLPSAYHQGKHDGEMVTFRSQSADLLMTPNHRIPLLKTSGTLRTVSAEELLSLGAGHHTIHAGKMVSGPGLPMSDAELRLLVAYQADGAEVWADGKWYGLEFSFTKDRKIERFREIAKELTGIEVRENHRPHGARFYLPLSQRLGELLAYLGESRVWGPWLLEMSSRQHEVFLEEIWKWDGCDTVQSQYAAKNKQNADWVQTMLVLGGVRANQRLYTNKHGHSVWIVDVRRTTTNAITHRAERTKVPWSDDVYCVTTPKDTIIVRRSGKVTITRQSQNFPKGMRGMVCAAPGHVLVGADMDQLELRIAAARWQVQLYLKAFADGKDPHSMTAFAVFGEEFCKAAGVDAKQFEQPGPLVGTSYKNGKFEGTGDDKKMRDLSKAVQYASQYMAAVETVHKLICKTEIPSKSGDGTTDLPYALLPLRRVRVMRDNWLKGASEFEVGWAKEIETFRRTGYIREPVTGRRRDFLDGEAPNEIVNFPIQSSAAGLMNRAILTIHEEIPRHKWGPGTGIINQCHDSIVIECPEAEAEGVARLMEEAMNQTHPDLPGVTFTATAEIGHTWKQVG